MAVSTRTYRTIAAIFKIEKDLADAGAKTAVNVAGLRRIAAGVAVTFAQHDPSFRRTAFLEACGLDA